MDVQAGSAGANVVRTDVQHAGGVVAEVHRQGRAGAVHQVEALVSGVGGQVVDLGAQVVELRHQIGDFGGGGRRLGGQDQTFELLHHAFDAGHRVGGGGDRADALVDAALLDAEVAGTVVQGFRDR